MKSYYKRYLIVAIPYTLALFACWNYIPIPFDIPIVISLVASLPLIMKRFLVKGSDIFKEGTWVCLVCSNKTKKSPCPRCNSTQFKIA